MKVKDAKTIINSKKYKSLIYKEIFKVIRKYGFTKVYLCNAFDVSRSKYSKWEADNDLSNPTLLFKTKEIEELELPDYVEKANTNAFNLVRSYFTKEPWEWQLVQKQLEIE